MIVRLMILTALLVLVCQTSLALVSGRIKLSDATHNEIALYPDRALIKQSFTTLPTDEGTLILEGLSHGGRESSFQLEYKNGNLSYVPEKLLWQKTGLSRDSVYRKLVGRSVELMGGGINVPVQGEVIAYDAGIALVQGNNGRQYIVDWNDSQGVRLASREQIFAEQRYTDQITAEFGQQKPEGTLELSYLTSSLSYSSNYRLILKSQGQGRLERQVTIRNDSDDYYKAALVQLVANKGGGVLPATYASRGVMLNSAGPARAHQKAERVGETLVTLLADKIDIQPYSRLQIIQFSQENIPIEKRYVFDVYDGSGRREGIEGLERPNLILRFAANADLASGMIEIFEHSNEGSAILSDTSQLIETIKGDYVHVVMREALAVRVDRIKLDSLQQGGGLQVRWQVTVHNDKQETIVFMLRDRDRNLLKLSEVKGAELDNTSVIEVKVPARSQKEITYTATYSR